MFTTAELKELEEFDKEVDAEELTYEAYKISNFIDNEFLFPKNENTYLKGYYQKNKGKMDARHKQYYEANKEKLTAYYKSYYRDNKEKLKAYNKERYKKIKANKKEINNYG